MPRPYQNKYYFTIIIQLQSKIMNPYSMFALSSPSDQNMWQMAQFPSLSQSVLQILLAKNSELRSQVAELKEKVKNMQNDLQTFKQAQSHMAIDSENQNNSERAKNKKPFTKHLLCPHSACLKRYSTKISLKTHLRRKHPRQTTS